MRAGELRDRVSIQRPNEVLNAAEEVETTWSEVAKVWAAVEPATGDESWIQALDQRVAHRMVRVRMRYWIGMDEQCRIVAGEQVLEVVSMPQMAKRKREMVLLCVALDPDEV